MGNADVTTCVRLLVLLLSSFQPFSVAAAEHGSFATPPSLAIYDCEDGSAGLQVTGTTATSTNQSLGVVCRAVVVDYLSSYTTSATLMLMANITDAQFFDPGFFSAGYYKAALIQDNQFSLQITGVLQSQLYAVKCGLMLMENDSSSSGYLYADTSTDGEQRISSVDDGTRKHRKVSISVTTVASGEAKSSVWTYPPLIYASQDAPSIRQGACYKGIMALQSGQNWGNNSFQYSQMQFYTGKPGARSPGDYWRCLDLAGATYCRASSYNVAWTGFCLPDSCTSNNVQKSFHIAAVDAIAELGSQDIDLLTTIADEQSIDTSLGLNQTQAQILNIWISTIAGNLSSGTELQMAALGAQDLLTEVTVWRCDDSYDNAQPLPSVGMAWVICIVIIATLVINATCLDLFWRSKQTHSTKLEKEVGEEKQWLPGEAMSLNNHVARRQGEGEGDEGEEAKGEHRRNNIPDVSMIYSKAKFIFQGPRGAQNNEHSHGSPPPLGSGNNRRNDASSNEDDGGDWKASGLVQRAIKGFSICRNWEKLIAVRRGHLQPLDGIRFFAACWVIIGHTAFYAAFPSGYGNPENVYPRPDGKGVTQTWWFQIVDPGAFLAVDVFLWLGGFLVAYSLLRRLDKVRRVSSFALSIPLIYIDRYLRLLPALLVVLGFYWAILPNIGSGPMWPYVQSTTEGCNKYWWVEILMLTAYNPKKWNGGGCMYHTWYLSVDLFCFVCTPIVLSLYKWRPKLGLLTLISLFTCWLIFYWRRIDRYELKTNNFIQDNPDAFVETYYYPWLRAAPYIVGVGFGLVYHRFSMKSPSTSRTTITATTNTTTTSIPSSRLAVGRDDDEELARTSHLGEHGVNDDHNDSVEGGGGEGGGVTTQRESLYYDGIVSSDRKQLVEHPTPTQRNGRTSTAMTGSRGARGGAYHTKVLIGSSLQIFGIGVICACLFGAYDAVKNAKCTASYICPNPGYKYTQFEANIYNTFSKPGMGVGFSLLMAAWIWFREDPCGAATRWFFTWPVFAPLAKLSYGAYLWHLFWVLLYYDIQVIPTDLTLGNLVYHSCGFIVMSFLSSFLSFLLVEAPLSFIFSSSLKVIIGGGRK